MATYTENYNLKMPSGQDAPDVEDFNTNAEIIDTVLKAHSDNTADEYSPDETYTAGRLVINNNALWKAKQDIDVAEPWTPAHWDATTIAAELKAQAEDIRDLNSSMEQISSRGAVYGDTFSPVDLEKATYTDIASIELPAGTFLLVGNSQINISGSGILILSIGNTSVRFSANSGGGATICTIYQLASPGTVSLQMYQNETQACQSRYTSFYAVKLT